MIRVALDELSSNLMLEFIKTQTKKSCSRKTIISVILKRRTLLFIGLRQKKHNKTVKRYKSSKLSKTIRRFARKRYKTISKFNIKAKY